MEKKQWVVAEPYPTDQGFSIYPTEDGYVIGIVWNDSPAAKLGLKSGYKIWRMGGVDFSKRSSTLDCELVMGVHKLRDAIHLEYLNDEGKIISVRTE